MKNNAIWLILGTLFCAPLTPSAWAGSPHATEAIELQSKALEDYFKSKLKQSPGKTAPSSKQSSADYQSILKESGYHSSKNKAAKDLAEVLGKNFEAIQKKTDDTFKDAPLSASEAAEDAADDSKEDAKGDTKSKKALLERNENEDSQGSQGVMSQTSSHEAPDHARPNHEGNEAIDPNSVPLELEYPGKKK